MGPVDALKLALQKEIESAKLYERLAAEHKAAKDVFIMLLNEEQKHKALIEDKIAELTS